MDFRRPEPHLHPNPHRRRSIVGCRGVNSEYVLTGRHVRQYGSDPAQARLISKGECRRVSWPKEQRTSVNVLFDWRSSEPEVERVRIAALRRRRLGNPFKEVLEFGVPNGKVKHMCLLLL